MKTKQILVLFLFALVACQKVDVSEPKGLTPNVPFDVPAGFDWSMHELVKISVAIIDQYDGKFAYRVKIYEGEDLLESGLVKGGEKFAAVVSVKKTTEELTIVQEDPNGDVFKEHVAINGNSVSFDFAAPTPLTHNATRSGLDISTRVPAKDGNDKDVILIKEGMKLEEGRTYVLRRYIEDIPVVKNVTIYIDGNGAAIQIKAVKETHWENVNLIIKNGKLVGLTPPIPSNVSIFKNVNITNYDQVHIYGEFKFEGCQFINKSTGEMFFANAEFSEDKEGKKSEIENDGLLVVGVARKKSGDNIGNAPSDWETEWGAPKADNEYLGTVGYLAEGNWPLTPYVTPVSYNYVMGWETAGNLVLNNTEVTLGANARIMARNITSNGTTIRLNNKSFIWASASMNLKNTTVKNVGDDYAVILVKNFDNKENGKFTISEQKNVTGKIVLDAEGGIEGVGGFLPTSGVKFTNDVAGTHLVQIQNKTYTKLNYYCPGYDPKDPVPLQEPPVEFARTRTIVMEDTYPGAGDMDMNDVVCEWALGKTKKGLGVTKVHLSYAVKALGSTKELAAAVALYGEGFKRTNIKQVTLSKDHSFSKYFNVDDKGLEVGNSDIVIPLFEDMHTTCFGMSAFSMINTWPDAPMKDVYYVDVVIEFDEPVANNMINADSVQFFMVLGGGINSRTEVHLYGNSATAKAFNKDAIFNDNKVIWGVELVSDFKYPTEMTKINEAYSGFTSWVTSSGTSNQDWYEHPEPGQTISR